MSMPQILAALRAVAEPTRLRLLRLCADGELTVSELTDILGQGQPSVSRHLKILCDAGLLDRFREGNWVFYRSAESAALGELAPTIVELLPGDDTDLMLDRQRMAEIKRKRVARAADYFRENASRWHRIRGLYVSESEVERILLESFPPGSIRYLLDIGTGTGRVLEVFADRCDRAVGIDLSLEMLAVARSNLEPIPHCSVRLGDMYKLPFSSQTADAVIVHQVLHFADEPEAVIGEAARVLCPGGRIAVADFALHDLERLRTEHAHRRLGFARDEVTSWFRGAGLTPLETIDLAGDPLTVVVWTASKEQLSEVSP